MIILLSFCLKFMGGEKGDNAVISLCYKMNQYINSVIFVSNMKDLIEFRCGRYYEERKFI